MRHPRTLTFLALAAASLLGSRDVVAQYGQTAMPPAAGVVNGAMAGLTDLNQNGPGWMYYGINAADRGLGYNGSYMTLGGFFPAVEDGLGGQWAADLRGHLSVNGGFFSNVGAVRKQFLGGTLLGVGVYWDYDGDQDQYPVFGTPGANWGQFGHTYNQVGVSGEWLTDFGNLRSNGYIPVGTTAYTIGAPGSPFTGNNILCQYGLDAALGGADLEVGAYIPGLTDWAGMISVGGYALGNTRYEWWSGPQTGQGVVPWFGGVYTRLDMTLIQNWDFSLQYNNDSYFDSTGFARLTYRMGGSRRRNVPDQMEQPMMRNEHIVRAHQTPIAAVNPVTGTPWRVFHVDNSAGPFTRGTAEAPFRTLAEAQAAATNPYDVVFVHAGSSATTPYASTWQFQAANQILVGEGSTLQLATANCGPRDFFTGSSPGLRPVLTSTSTAITLADGAIVDHFRIQDAPVGIAAGPALAAGANVNDVAIVGTNAPGQVGIQMTNVPSGTVNFFNMAVTNMGRGFWVDGGAATVNFQGEIRQTASAAESVLVQNATGGTVNVNQDINTLNTPVAFNNVVSQVTYGVFDSLSTAAAPINVSLNTNTAVNIRRATITSPTQRGVAVQSNLNTQVTFIDLSVVDAAASAFVTESNNAASVVTIGPTSSLSSTSTTLAVFESNDDAQFAIELASVTSAIPQTVPPAPPGPPAILLNGASTGFLSVNDTFTVGGQPGTAANVTNTTPVTVTVP